MKIIIQSTHYSHIFIFLWEPLSSYLSLLATIIGPYDSAVGFIHALGALSGCCRAVYLVVYSILWLRLGLAASRRSTDAIWLHLWQRGTRPGILGFCQYYPTSLPQFQHVKVLSWGIWVTFQKLPSVIKSSAASSNSLIFHTSFNFFLLWSCKPKSFTAA